MGSPDPGGAVAITMPVSYRAPLTAKPAELPATGGSGWINLLFILIIGGARRDRTVDLLHAMQFRLPNSAADFLTSRLARTPIFIAFRAAFRALLKRSAEEFRSA
jgi:hypothetical protein